MEIFIDTANLEEIRQAWEWGVISGVTTNPSLVAREGRDLRQVVREIASIVNGPISAEVMSLDRVDMVEEARELASIHPNVVIKIPITEEGLPAIKQLSREGVPTNCTLIFSANQALLAARAGATYVSPFVGRLDDVGQDGMLLVEEIVDILTRHELNTRVIAASIRHPLHVTQAARLGAHIATVPFGVIRQMIKHPLTDIGITRFLADWEKVNKK
ncbi:MAG: fructose-6-phosphate aldolase [Syntrophomonadaceae bacterium]|nr:fructose-6-phosphate aldolase [Syntrophomonadaceae bacterium]